jgi:hypothetical protein
MMGYQMELADEDFHVVRENFKYVFNTAQRFMRKAEEERDRPFPWMHAHWDGGWKEWESVEDVFDAWRFPVWVEEDGIGNGGITGIKTFAGEKLGAEDEFFDAIAQFVSDESYIEMVGEDGKRWRWVFKESEVVEKQIGYEKEARGIVSQESDFGDSSGLLQATEDMREPIQLRNMNTGRLYLGRIDDNGIIREKDGKGAFSKGSYEVV